MTGRIATRWIALILLVTVALQGVTASSAMAQGQQQVTWETYDVTVRIDSNGTMRVTESALIRFNGGFSRGTRTIPMDRIESIDDVAVSVGRSPDDLAPLDHSSNVVLADPGTFIAAERSGEYTIQYRFDWTTADDNVRAVEISYTVHGAIRDYPDATPPEQQLRWTVISSDVTGTGPVESASATVIFPQPIPANRLAIDPPATSVEPDRVAWAPGTLDEGESLKVAVAFEPVTSATAPSWQAAADSGEFRSDMLPGINIVIGLAALVGSAIMVLVMIGRGVRDPDVGLVADILTERPDDLPAPLVGALVDERVDARDAIAAVFDLQREGIISIRDDDGVTMIRLDTPVSEAPAWYRPMLEGLFSGGVTGEDHRLDKSITAMRRTAWAQVPPAWEDELFARGLYAGRPKDTRSRWLRGFLLLDAVVGIAVVVAWRWADQFSPWAIFPLAVAAVALVIGLSQVSKAAMKTREGAMVAATWRAYGRYLDGLRKDAEPGQFLEALERDLPWAIALGFDRSWKRLERPQRNLTPIRGRSGSPPRISGGYGDVAVPDVGRPFDGLASRVDGGGLQGASATTFSAIAGGSTGLFTMLDSAAASFDAGARPSPGTGSGGPSGGGFSGGFSGSASSGSSGGGGHSFS